MKKKIAPKKKPGPKPLPVSLRRSVTLTSVVTKEVRAAVKHRAKELDMSVSDYLLDLVEEDLEIPFEGENDE